MKIRKAVGIILLDELNNILLVHKVKIMDGKSNKSIKNGEWDFPKGGIKKNETIKDALEREIYEETNIKDYKVLNQLPNFEFEFSDELKKILDFDKQITYFYSILFTGNKTDIKPDFEEVDDIRFFNFEDTIEKLHHENSKEYLLMLKRKKLI